jgi:hypothetical protein
MHFVPGFRPKFGSIHEAEDARPGENPARICPAFHFRAEQPLAAMLQGISTINLHFHFLNSTRIVLLSIVLPEQVLVSAVCMLFRNVWT